MSPDLSQMADDWKNKPLVSLIEHIVQTHHAFCRQELPRLAALFKSVNESVGEEHPEVKQIQVLFYQMARDLNMHLLKEEQTLFPYITKFETAVTQSEPVSWPLFGSVENPVRMMVLEHVKADHEIEEMRKLSNEYQPPAGAGKAYVELYEGLAAFDQDMQRHIQSEDHMLFPRAVAMEKEACDAQKAAAS